jgi:hypothetical protein
MKLISSLIAMALIAGGTAAQAAGKKQSLHDQFTGQGYGMAGCGLGSVVFGDKPGMIQVIAATLNSTGYQTFAISTGTSNCGDSGKAARANQFIEVNKVAVENDLARGTGEAVASLGIVMGCQNTDFSTQLRRNYTAGASVEQMSQAAATACKL